jgi:hypothetical protein
VANGFFTIGSLAQYKARWVLRGFTQQEGVDYGKTCSLMVKPATICVALSKSALQLLSHGLFINWMSRMH